MKKIKMIKVTSDHLESVGWEKEYQFDEKSKKVNTLRIEFNDDSLYDYEEVSRRTFNALVNSKSKGTFFFNRVRNKYKTIKRK